MIAEFALDVIGAASAMLFFDPRQRLLQLAKPIFSSLCCSAARDHALHKRFLFRQTLLSFAEVAIEWAS